MDKKQKELVQSYYHARNIALEQEQQHEWVDDAGYKDYEIVSYALKGKLMDTKRVFNGTDARLYYIYDNKIYEHLDPKDFPRDLVLLLLRDDPEKYVEVFRDQFDDYGYQTIFYLLKYTPELIDMHKWNLNGFDAELLLQLLDAQPQLFSKLKERLDLNFYSGNFKHRLFFNHPEFIDAHKWELTGSRYPYKNLEPKQILPLIKHSPQLEKTILMDVLHNSYFKEEFKDIRDSFQQIDELADIARIITNLSEKQMQVRNNREYDKYNMIIALYNKLLVRMGVRQRYR